MFPTGNLCSFLSLLFFFLDIILLLANVRIYFQKRSICPSSNINLGKELQVEGCLIVGNYSSEARLIQIVLEALKDSKGFGQVPTVLLSQANFLNSSLFSFLFITYQVQHKCFKLYLGRLGCEQPQVVNVVVLLVTLL